MLTLNQMSTLEDDELAGTYMKANLVSTQPLPKTFKDILTNYYHANLTENSNTNASTGQVLELLSDSGVMSHWKDYHKLAVYTYCLTSRRFPSRRREVVPSMPMIPQVGGPRARRVSASQRAGRANC
ncbi:hypothetical protein LSTR_LSTR011381 [Laodelphax striatellus]|uniref:Uncharacterized protein n=1 Tax=Laodelphax striatellus TaxID=195883 RepID=A0A482XSJ0_LAOST|nr:hypothetical protein LSTR_LSTR011381 [Laodelphax striatellus]